MRLSRSLLPIALMVSALPLAASAQDTEESGAGLSWNLTATSEYFFRGISQSDDRPALQAGFDYAFDSGFYAGAWASTVDFGDSTDAELDAFIGWNRDLNTAINLDLQMIRYNYIGEPAGVDYAYNEWIGLLKISDTYLLTLGYTNDYLNADVDSLYFGVGGEWDLGSDYLLTAGVGYTTIDGPGENYFDYSIGVSRTFGLFNIGLSYIDTSSAASRMFGRDASEGKVMLSVTIEG